MRKSFNGLVSLTRNVQMEDPQSVKLFVFYGKSGNVLKVLGRGKPYNFCEEIRSWKV